MSANGATRSAIRAVDVFGQHVVQQLQSFRAHFSGGASVPPLFVAMQGPLGSGKTTVTRALIQYLNSSGLNVGILSTDDLYHTHENLIRVARENPTNPLLSGRGQPGTADDPLPRREPRGARVRAGVDRAAPGGVAAAARCFRERGARLRVYACPACCR